MKVLALFLIISQFIISQDFWQKISTPEYSANVILITDDNRIYLGTYSGVYISTDQGFSWIRSDNGMGEVQVNSLAAGINNEIYAGANFSGLYVSNDNGMNWQNLGIAQHYINCILVTNESQLLVGTYSYLYKSFNGGSDWQIDSLSMAGREIWTLFQDSKNNLYAGTDCGLFRSGDSGSSWQFIESFNCGDILSFTESNDGNIYMGGADRFHGIYKSTDNGLSWETVFNIGKSLETNSMVASPSGRIFASSMIQSDSGGVYATSASDTLWILLNSGLQINRSRYLAINSDGYLYSTYGSIYRSKEPVTGLVGAQDIKAQGYLISQNFPNPFNPVTKISYTLPSKASVNLKVYNILGQLITTLVSEVKPAGFYEVDFNAANLPSGVYIYRMTAGSFVETKKMLLVR